MRKFLIATVGLVLSLSSSSQKVKGSIQQGSAPNKVNVVYLPDNNTTAGEYVQYLSVSVAIPTSSATGVTPTIASAGPFSPTLAFTPAVPFSYTVPDNGGETIYSWICSNNTSFAMSWSTGVSFVGATITFNGAPGTVHVRMVDRTNLGSGGGDNNNTFFNVGVNIAPFDLTDYTNFFFQITGAPGGNNSATGTYGNGDQYVETALLISLPVNLINFSGYKNGGKNTLNWTVASEVSNRGFEVQRSLDGVNYTPIGFVNSQVGGYSNSNVHYTFDDVNPSGMKQYYRLNQKDIDGNGKLSSVIVISGDKPNILGIGGLFPNPANTLINVRIDAPQRDKVTLVITDMAGKIVKQQVESVDVGSNTVPVDIAKLAGGSYLVKLVCQSSDCETASAKFNKQ